MMNDPLFQVIISLIILILMGYFAYNIYLIEFEKMLKSTNGARKETIVFKGIYDFNKSNEVSYETSDKTKQNFIDINPSINQEGGAEYSYNFWLCVDKDSLKTSQLSSPKNDIVLFLKGEKKMYYSSDNYNCSNKKKTNDNDNYNYNVMIKNPLVRLNNDGSSIVIEYNNIYNEDSYKNRSKYTECDKIDETTDWYDKNKNLLGVYDLNFNKKWFMVSIIFKEVADSNNIMIKNRASCKMYINGINVLDKKVETKYKKDIFSATFKNNKSPLLVNPNFNNIKSTLYANNILNSNSVKMSDLKYYNYAITELEVQQLYRNGFTKYSAVILNKTDESYDLVSSAEMNLQEIKEI